MKKLSPYIKLAVLCLFLSTAAHAAYLVEWSENRFMLGPNDGLSQMMPFKAMLYEQYTSGEFFYSPYFGLGSGTFSGLSYYFSTSIIVALTTVFFFLLELLGIVSEPDILFWAHAAVFINITRLAAVLFISFFVFRYMKLGKYPALIAAAIYGLSSMYFRHAVYWEFFSDAYLWLPVLIFGAEKMFREGKPGWFVAGVALSMIDSFYFAYINLLLTGIYILFRLFMPLAENEIKRKKAVVLFLTGGFIGAGISAISFIPAVYAFTHNHRPPYRLEIEWLAFHDNILFTSSYVIVPAAFVGMLFAMPLFQNRLFRFFAALVLFSVLLHYSPQIASVFNGFSAPQFRWEYFLSFASGGAVGAGFNILHLLKLKHITVSGGLALIVYAIFAFFDARLEIAPATILAVALLYLFLFVVFAFFIKRDSSIGQAVVAAVLLLVFLVAGYEFIRAVAEDGVTIQFPLFMGVYGSALLTFLLLLRAVREQTRTWEPMVFIVITLLVLANGFQYVNLIKGGNTQSVSEEYITGEDYDDPEINALLEEIDERGTFPFYRIDWMEGIRNNTPIVQKFHGLSAYSSILNEEILYFYLHELEIDMARESVSRYATLGKRTNLHSLLLGNYVILPYGDENVPAGFEHILESENYAVYENQLPLPFIRSASATFSEESLEDEPVLRREHAMLTGVVLKDPEDPAPLPPNPEELPYKIEEVDAVYEAGVLDVTGEEGGIDLQLERGVPEESDLYVAFHLTHHTGGRGFPLSVNSYRTTRKSDVSVYRTYADHLTIRIPAEDTVRIRVPQGTYNLTEIAVYEEPYEVLRTEADKRSGVVSFKWEGSQIEAGYENREKDDFIVFPVPYEIGWKAEVNGREAEVLEANYAFLAVPAEDGLNEIKLTYRPPHFWKSAIISLVSLIVAAAFVRRHKKSGSIKK